MDPFGNDPFEDIVREFLGHPSGMSRKKSRRITPTEENNIEDFIETEIKIYVIFELPGYEEEDISVKIKGNVVEIFAKKKNMEKVQNYLKEKLSQENHIRKTLPEKVNKKNYNYELKNGILELELNKK